MTDKKATHIVTRSGFYQRFGGKLQALKPGTPLALTKDRGERLVKRGFVKAIEPEKSPEKAAPTEQPKAQDEAEPESVKEEKQKKKKKKKTE